MKKTISKIKKSIKRMLDKTVKIFMILAVTSSSFIGFIPITEVQALASGVTGDQIIQTGQQYYGDWGYWEVGTCTGFVTRTLNRLGITAVVGDHPYNIYTKQSEGGARRSPLAMYNHAMANPSEAKLVWQGYVKNIKNYAHLLKNGDLIITRPEDRAVYTGDGHVAFIHKYGTTISQFGAGQNGIDDAIMTESAPAVGTYSMPTSESFNFQAASSSSEKLNTEGVEFEDWVDPEDLPIGGMITVNGEDYVTVFRLLADEPQYDTLTSTKTSTESVQVQFLKTDIDSGKVLSGVTVDFFRDDVKFATDITNSQGIAKATYQQTYTATSGVKEYCTNYDDLDAEGRQKVADRGAYTSKAAAQSSADVEAQTKSNQMASGNHRYSVVETLTKTKYWLNPNNSTVSDSITGSGTISVSLTNKRVMASIKLFKTDYDTGLAQGQNEATLDGALYGLYARENILDPADASIIYSAGDEVARVRTIDAKAQVDNLYLGSYFWKEITAPEGYKLDQKEYDIEVIYAGQTISTVIGQSTLKEQVITGNFDLEKVIVDGDFSEINKKEEGAEFLVVAKKYVDKYGTIEEAWKHRDEFTDKEYDKLITSSQGYAKSKDLAYGDFVVKQVKGQVDTDVLEPEWIFSVKRENQETQRYIVSNRIFRSYLKLVKKDVETGKRILLDNATFKIRNLDTGAYLTQKVGSITYDVWTTGEDATVVLPLELKAGNYALEEIKSPNLYLKIDNLPFKITNSNVVEKDEDGDALTTVEIYDQPVKGQIEVTKTGEVLTDIKKDENGNIQFIYEEKPLSGMTVDIIAKENVLDPADGSIIFKKGTLVETLVTEDGYAISSLLPLGEYIVKERISPDLMVLDTKEYEVSLKFKDNITAVIMDVVSVNNERQKVDANIIKRDSETKQTVQGAVFNLYAKKDIFNYKGELLISAGTLVESGITDENGIYKFEADLPVTMDKEDLFLASEEKAAEGYYLNSETIDINTTYAGQTTKIILINKDFYNEIMKFKLRINKVDDKTLQNIISKDFAFTRCEDAACTKPIETVHANTEEGVALFDIRYGSISYVKESSAPEGYALSKEVVKVEVNSDGFYINDLKIVEGEDASYSILYQNTLLPVIATGYDTHRTLFILLTGISTVGIAIVLLSLKKRSLKK